MQKLIGILSFCGVLALCCVLTGVEMRAITIVIGQPRPVSGGGADITENFEGTGAPSGWSTSAGTINYDQATTGLALEASQCLNITANAGAEQAYVAFTASDTVYSYFLMRVENTPGGAGRTLFKLTDGSGNTCFENAPNIGPHQVAVYDLGEAHNDVGGTSIADDQTYHVWTEYEKGTGANAQIRIFLSTTSTKPGSPEVEITNGASGRATEAMSILTNSASAAQPHLEAAPHECPQENRSDGQMLFLSQADQPSP